MRSRKSLMCVCALAGLIGSSTLMAGCSETTAPPARTLRAPSAVAQHDDGPPDTPCRSGWIITDGRYVCENP